MGVEDGQLLAVRPRGRARRDAGFPCIFRRAPDGLADVMFAPGRIRGGKMKRLEAPVAARIDECVLVDRDVQEIRQHRRLEIVEGDRVAELLVQGTAGVRSRDIDRAVQVERTELTGRIPAASMALGV